MALQSFGDNQGATAQCVYRLGLCACCRRGKVHTLKSDQQRILENLWTDGLGME